MCFHQETGRESDSEHKTGSIFANAASVLSMAAEEISLDDHLEKELANEVELWRMETSSTAVHTDSQYRTVFAGNGPQGLGGPGSLDSMESDMEAESVGESQGRDRGRGSADLANGRRRVVPGTREGTGLSTEASGSRQGFSTPVTESREETATSSLPNGGACTAGSSEDACSGLSDMREVQNHQAALYSKALAGVGAAIDENVAVGAVIEGNGFGAAATASGAGANRTPGSQPLPEHTHPSRLVPAGKGPSPRGVPPAVTSPSPRAQTYLGHEKGKGQVEAGQKDAHGVQRGDLEEIPLRDNTTVSASTLGEAPIESPLGPKRRKEPEMGHAVPNDDDSFSSSEDSFPGFIEDPIEKEMTASALNDTLLNNYRLHAAGLSNYNVPSPREEACVKPTPKAIIKVRAAGGAVATSTVASHPFTNSNNLEGVREDRSAF